MKQLFLCLILFTNLFTASAFAAVFDVPETYRTIQEAIDASADGDTIFVADGLYAGEGNKDLDTDGKSISVLSENGPETCIIDCEGDGRGFMFNRGEGNDTLIQGFTIRNGLISCLT